MATCLECGFTAKGEDFDPCISPYHDLRCPKCGTTHIDTATDNKDWDKEGFEYGYGNDNFLKTQ